MILLYCNTITPRLQYSISLLEQLTKCNINFTTNEQEFDNAKNIKINYSNRKFERCFSIIPEEILFDNSIKPVEVKFYQLGELPVLFYNTLNGGFDMLAGIFFLASRYEEYLPHTKDSFGRYAHQNATAWQFGFLHRPILHEWAAYLAKSLEQYYASPLHFNKQNERPFFLATYDIDIAWSYLHKRWWRNLGGWIKKPGLDRIKVLLNHKKDPFDSYLWMSDLHKKFQLPATYFFLVAEKNAVYDKNILPDCPALQQLIKDISVENTIGLHPSWQSGNDPTLISSEKKRLEEIAGKPITFSRQHYIRFSMPNTYRQLITAGILEDYSMGYGSINGFRASIAIPYYWFDLEKNLTTSLVLHPFCFMDANSFYEQKDSPEQALADMKYYIKTCKKWGGTCISIWHNHFLGSDKLYKGWSGIYEEAMKYATSC